MFCSQPPWARRMRRAGVHGWTPWASAKQDCVAEWVYGGPENHLPIPTLSAAQTPSQQQIQIEISLYYFSMSDKPRSPAPLPEMHLIALGRQALETEAQAVSALVA